MNSGITILKKIVLKWRLLIIAEALCWAISIAFLIASVHGVINLDLSLFYLIPASVFGGVIWFYKPWEIGNREAAKVVDAKLPAAENSACLLVERKQDLSLIAQIQRQKIDSILANTQRSLNPPHHLHKSLIGAIILCLFGLGIQNVEFKNSMNYLEPNGLINFSSKNPEVKSIVKIESQQVRISPPIYSRLLSTETSNMNINSLEGSTLFWSLTFNGEVQEVSLETIGKRTYKMKKVEESYQLRLRLENSGFYKFIYLDNGGQSHESDIFQLISAPDEQPKVSVEGIDRFTLLEFSSNKNVSFTANMSDDLGLAATSIIATVSKGTGESVKFREERMDFDNSLKSHQKSAKLTKTVNLDNLKMTPGDELYFYVEVFDNKLPKPNRSRTETYFISIRDTTQYEFSLEGALGVDLMPDYFRSQRQLIIDTEKLIKDKPKLAKKDFNFTSNELGFDQKSLRLKYGQFMGEEFESELSAEPETADTEVVDEEQTEEDPLAEYSHDHDGDNEHNLVAVDDTEEEDPLEAYQHDHDNPEETTLYVASIKGKLKAAMTEMWDAELYLRLFEPEKSLPYQYRALELIKEIKNHARIYVHRMGFDPPPIKEDKRLSGNIKEVKSSSISTNYEGEQLYPGIRKALVHISYLLDRHIDQLDHEVLKIAGNELALLAVENPVKYLGTLQQLQQVILDKLESANLAQALQHIHNELNEALPKPRPSTKLDESKSDALTNTYLDILNADVND